MECRIIKSGHSPNKDFTIPTPKASRHSNLNFCCVSQSEQEMEYIHMTSDTGLQKVVIFQIKIFPSLFLSQLDILTLTLGHMIL